MKKKKQIMRRSSNSSSNSFKHGDVQFTVMNDGRVRVTTPEGSLPEFLARAREAIQAGRIDEAKALINDDNIKIVQQMVEKDPSRMAAMYILAMTLVGIGRFDAAEEWYEKILKRDSHWAVYNELGNIKEKRGQRAKEMEYRKKALEANPDNGVALNNYGILMVRMSDAQQGIEILRKAVEKAFGNPVVHSNLLFFMHYLPDVDCRLLFDEHKRWARMQAPTTLAGTSHDNVPDPDRRLRIGYISPDFYTHSVAYFFEILLDEQNHQAVETYGYSSTDCPDHITERLKSKLDHFRNIYGVSDENVVDMIKKDKIDILVDLAGHTRNNRLPVLAHKPAPIQVTYLGYPDTTGMEQVDYRFTDELADPPESQQFYTEELVYLPDGFLSYRPPDYAPPVAPLPVLKNGYITFGSFNNNCKINPFIISLWAEILKSNENSRLLLKFRGGGDKMLKDHYLHQFEQLGICPDRVDIHGPKRPVEHLKLYSQVDIALDTYPYNGTTTTFEALWMGVPTISLAGEHHMSRVGLTILTRFGMGFLAASTPQEYVARATALAAKSQTLAEMRAIMRRTIAGASLCNTNKFARNVEAAYRKMWHKWCRSRGVEVATQQVTSDEKSSCTDAQDLSSKPAQLTNSPKKAKTDQVAKRGVLYITWGDSSKTESSLRRSIASVQQHHPELPIHVENFPNGSKMDKTKMLELTPFKETLYLDSDTVVLGRLDFAFEKAKKFGLACGINECPWARRFTDSQFYGDIVEYNSGVLFFTKKAKPVFDMWQKFFPTVDSSIIFYSNGRKARQPVSDQAGFALAVEKSGFLPFVLPYNWNFRPIWHKSFFGPIKIWHDYTDVPPDILKWNENQVLEENVIQYTELARNPRPKQPAPPTTNASSRSNYPTPLPSVPLVPNTSTEVETKAPEIFPDDLMIVSYPRSGNTWVRFLLANLVANPDQPLDFQAMENLVPDIHKASEWDKLREMPSGRMIKSHMPYDPAYKKVIYIVRDGRDAKVSHYHYHCPHNFQATFLKFLQTDVWPGPWHRHVESWLDHTYNNFFLLVRYEDLLEQPIEQLRRIADFANLPNDEERLARAVKYSAFDSLKKIEMEWGYCQVRSPDFKFFRKGTCDQWKEYFGPEHKDLFKQYANPTLRHLGYIDQPDW